MRVSELEGGQENWLNAHEGHSEVGAADGGAFPGVKWGRLFRAGGGGGGGGEEEGGDDGEEDDEPQLLRCCGQDRPRGKNTKLTIRPARAWDGCGGGGFVTVHDYVSALHPWLGRLGGRIRASDYWRLSRPSNAARFSARTPAGWPR